MDQTLPLTPGSADTDTQEGAQLQASIDRCLAEMDSLRSEMGRQDTAIADSSAKTHALLEEIRDVVTRMKAA